MNTRTVARAALAAALASTVAVAYLHRDALDAAALDAWLRGAGATNVPVESLPQRVSELQAWRDRPLAVICRTNRRSGAAARQLREQGFRNVLLVNDGMLAWEQAGFLVEKPRHG